MYEYTLFLSRAIKAEFVGGAGGGGRMRMRERENVIFRKAIKKVSRSNKRN
jgi:hypothetical protein